MVNKTISEGLMPYGLGEKLRALRLKKSMGLVELGRHTKLSPAMLSKLERGKLFPTLPTLLRIAMVFSVGLAYFFTDDRKRHVVAVVRKNERLRFPEKPGGGASTYHFESLDFKATERKLSAFYADFELVAPEKIRMHQHAGVEFLYVLRGKLEIVIGSDAHRLDEGDSIYFDSGVRHSYWRMTKQRCSAIIVTTP
ncbi:MAG: helix-turn-helix domain-containing protein [Terriglobales bacterium]